MRSERTASRWIPAIRGTTRVRMLRKLCLISQERLSGRLVPFSHQTRGTAPKRATGVGRGRISGPLNPGTVRGTFSLDAVKFNALWNDK